MIGIEFNISNFRDFLKGILDKINLDEYDFYITEEEIFNIEGDSIFYNGVVLKDDIDFLCNERYSVIFMNLKVYPKGDETININQYADFKNSKCELIVLLVDSNCIEIYFKENEFKKNIFRYLEQNDILYNVKDIETDGRYCMSII